MSRVWISHRMLAAGMAAAEARGVFADNDVLREVYEAMADARALPTPVARNEATLLHGDHWKHFAGWRVQPATTVGVVKDGVRVWYDIVNDEYRPVQADDMELAPPEAA